MLWETRQNITSEWSEPSRGSVPHLAEAWRSVFPGSVSLLTDFRSWPSSRPFPQGQLPDKQQKCLPLSDERTVGTLSELTDSVHIPSLRRNEDTRIFICMVSRWVFLPCTTPLLYQIHHSMGWTVSAPHHQNAHVEVLCHSIWMRLYLEIRSSIR